MFSFFRKKKKPAGKNKGKNTGKNTAAKGKETKAPQSRREQIMQEALSNARQARAEIGEENIQKIAEAIARQQSSRMEKAKREILEHDREDVAAHLRNVLKD